MKQIQTVQLRHHIGIIEAQKLLLATYGTNV